MGQALVRVASEFPTARITGTVASAGSASLGRDAGVLAGVVNWSSPAVTLSSVRDSSDSQTAFAARRSFSRELPGRGAETGKPE